MPKSSTFSTVRQVKLFHCCNPGRCGAHDKNIELLGKDLFLSRYLAGAKVHSVALTQHLFRQAGLGFTVLPKLKRTGDDAPDFLGRQAMEAARCFLSHCEHANRRQPCPSLKSEKVEDAGTVDFKKHPHGRWGQGPGNLNPRFLAGLSFPVSEILKFVAFRNAGKFVSSETPDLTHYNLVFFKAQLGDS